MTIITPPARLPLSQVSWRLQPAAQVNRSGWTGRRKVVGLPGADVWSVSGQFASITTLAKALPWRAFFLSLHGPINSFPVVAVPEQQTAAANPAVRIGAGDGDTMPLEGLPASATVLAAGMMMTVFLPTGHRRLVGLVEPLVSDAAGDATATFWPELGEVPAAGAAVEIQWPYGLMALPQDSYGWDMSDRIKHGFALKAEEAL